jgi:NhaP-type Na+/H+ or K+/H+ antiporter
MSEYMLVLVGLGSLILLVAWLPMLLKELPLSLPMFCIGFGALAFWLAPVDVPLPTEFPKFTERMTELIVVVALTGAGLKLDRPIGWRSWNLTWRLLGIAMPLSILAIALIGSAVLGLGIAAALLLGAALAPTDPVLAGDIQVGPPGEGEEDEVRFTLTAEAGMNDALAFPFVHLALLFAVAGAWPDATDWGEWFAVKVLWKLGAGLAVGWGIGKALGWLLFRIPNRAGLAQTREGFVALGITFIAYAVTELCQGYGFLAVFIAALTLRDSERGHEYHERLHEFTDQIERLLMMVLLVLFGGTITAGLLAPLNLWALAGVALILFVARPLAGMISLLGHPAALRERWAIAFFGIRGLGSMYYLAYATTHHDWEEAPLLWAIMGLTVLCSVVLHGTTVTPAMAHLDQRRQRARGAPGRASAALPAQKA